MGVKVKHWKGAYWVFVNHRGQRKAKRCASKRAAEIARDQIDAKLKLGHVEVLRPAAPLVAPQTTGRHGRAIFAARRPRRTGPVSTPGCFRIRSRTVACSAICLSMKSRERCSGQSFSE